MPAVSCESNFMPHCLCGVSWTLTSAVPARCDPSAVVVSVPEDLVGRPELCQGGVQWYSNRGHRHPQQVSQPHILELAPLLWKSHQLRPNTAFSRPFKLPFEPTCNYSLNKFIQNTEFYHLIRSNFADIILIIIVLGCDDWPGWHLS